MPTLSLNGEGSAHMANPFWELTGSTCVRIEETWINDQI